MRMKGLFITFEGPDGSGKTTQIKKLARYFAEKHIDYILTREPGGTPISDVIRSIILDPASKGMTDKTEVLLYAASRSQHVEEKIRPALAAGKIVLCDRFIDASIAYQGYGLGLPIDKINAINQFASGGLVPNRTYMIDISPEAGRRRMEQRRGPAEPGSGMAAGSLDRIERRELAYHKRVREGFRAVYRENKDRICLIDGDQQTGAVFSDILQDFHFYFKNFK